MSRFALSLACSLLLLSACQREAPSASGTGDASNQASMDAQTKNASPEPATTAPAVPIKPFDVTPFGIESCDAFVAAINRCFATARAHPSAVQVLRPPYEQELQRWRRMKDEPNLAPMLDKVCKTQLDGMPSTREGLKCE